MMARGQDELVCDFAETYHIIGINEMRALPVPLLATLASGLGEESRIRRKLKNEKISLDTLLRAMTVDYLAMLVWIDSGAARNHKKRPESIVAKLQGVTKTRRKESSLMTFETKDDFQRKWAELTGGSENNGN